MPPKSRSRTVPPATEEIPAPTDTAPGNFPSTETTGRFLVLLREDAGKNAIKALREAADLPENKLAMARDFKEGEIDSTTLGGADGLVFEALGVAVVDAPPTAVRSLQAAAADEGQPEILAVEAERVVYAFEADLDSRRDYLRGFHRGVEVAIAEALGRGTPAGLAAAEEAVAQDTNFTWGLMATRVNSSSFSGNGIRVAVLDTGLDVSHPDFNGRAPITASFIQGQSVQDGNGHGTHCVGTSCGSLRPNTGLPRYGVAHRAQILAGKVLSNAGSGSDSGILAGIQWALQNQAHVISMSLGARVRDPNLPFSQIFETVGQRALTAGTLVIAAAGNDSRRPAAPWAVSHPANCPSFLAVAAVDRDLRVASFSNAGLNPNGGKVDIAGPGVDVDSSWPQPRLRNTISGTSMATPHVAGIAALIAEARPSARGALLWQALVSATRPLSAQSRDVGAGLAQAPQ
jgi:subtilisin family serine protease